MTFRIGKVAARMKDRVESAQPTNSIENAPVWRKLAAIGALSTVALTGCTSSDPQTSQDSFSSTDVVVENEVDIAAFEAAYYDSILTGEELTESLQIPAGLSDEELGQAVIDNITAWVNYGATPELREWIDQRGEPKEADIETFSDIASSGADGIVPAMFVEDWQTSSITTLDGEANQLVSLVSTLELANETGLDFYYRTSDGEYSSPLDIEPYYRWTELQYVVNKESTALDENEREIVIYFSEYANTDKNRSLEIGANENLTPEGHGVRLQIKLEEIDGREYINTLFIEDATDF